MPATRKRKIFGPLLYSTLAVAAVVLVLLGIGRSFHLVFLGIEKIATASEQSKIRSSIQKLGDRDPKVRDRAVEQLRRRARAPPQLLEAMKKRDAGVRSQVCIVLETLIPERDATAKAVLDALAEALADPDPLVRRQAVETLDLQARMVRVQVTYSSVE